MLVKIINGTYGHRPNPDETRVVRKDSQSPAFELNDEEAKRLISLGVAERCDTEMKTGLNAASSTELPGMTAEDIESMEFNDLRKVAKSYGLNTKGTKEELILRLKTSLFPENGEDDAPDEIEDGGSDDDSGETIPEFDAQEPVV